MKLFRKLFLAAQVVGSALFSPLVHGQAQAPGKFRILLLGDSTTIGSVCRDVNPAGPHLEQVVARSLQAETGRPTSTFDVVNQGRDGEFIEGVLSGGRYDKEIKGLGSFDYIFIRYGINDSVLRTEFETNFPKDYQDLIGRLRKDFPGATLVPTLIIPYLGEERDATINTLIHEVATAEKLPVFDVYSPYKEQLKAGANALNYRRYPLDKVPEGRRGLAEGFVRGGAVTVMDNQLDVHFGDLPGWYGDRHPNLAGYQVIAAATARFLSPLLQATAKK